MEVVEISSSAGAMGNLLFPLGKLVLCPYFRLFFFFSLLYSFHGHNLKLLTQLIFNIISFQNE